jgi:CBS-domain-containing membrane protein
MTFFLQPDLGQKYFSQHKAYGPFFTKHPKVKDEFKVLRTTVDTLMEGRRPAITLSQARSQKEALELMVKHKLISLPLLTDDEKVVGFVTYLDILTTFAFNPKFAKQSQVDVRALEDVLHRQLLLPAGYLLGATNESSRFTRVDAKDQLITLLPILCQGTHRVWVDTTDAKTGVVLSQTDVIRFFLQNIRQLGSVTDLKVETMVDVSGKKLVGVDHKTSTLWAFREMLINEVSALPVIDSKGQLVCSLSATDARGMTQGQIKDLLLPVEDFLRARVVGGELPEPVVCSKEDTLETVIKALVNKKVHRVWVTHENRPVGVVSMTDVIGAVFLDKVERAA